MFTATGTGVYWCANFGQVQRLKAVLIMGELNAAGEVYTANGVGWKVTFGNSANPCTNLIIYT